MKKDSKSESKKTIPLISPKPKASGAGIDFAVMVFVIIIFCSTLIAVIVLNSAIDAMNVTAVNLAVEERRYDYRVLTEKSGRLLESGKELGIKSISSSDATYNLLRKADEINLLYGGELVNENLIYDDIKNQVSAKMAISLTPPSPEEFLKLVKYLADSRLPMIYISKASIVLEYEGRNKYLLNMELMLMHPYSAELTEGRVR